MKTNNIDARIIVLLAVTALMSGCGDEQKETSKQPEQTVTESVPASPVSEISDKTVETKGSMAESTVKKSVEAVERATEQTVEKTAEIAQDLGVKAETKISEAATTGQVAISKASSEVVKTTPALVRKIQQALADAGVNPGAIDGIMGPKTIAAVKSFQKQKGLAEGAITEETLQALEVAY